MLPKRCFSSVGCPPLHRARSQFRRIWVFLPEEAVEDPLAGRGGSSPLEKRAGVCVCVSGSRLAACDVPGGFCQQVLISSSWSSMEKTKQLLAWFLWKKKTDPAAVFFFPSVFLIATVQLPRGYIYISIYLWSTIPSTLGSGSVCVCVRGASGLLESGPKNRPVRRIPQIAMKIFFPSPFPYRGFSPVPSPPRWWGRCCVELKKT